jgi:hypothetical protein
VTDRYDRGMKQLRTPALIAAAIAVTAAISSAAGASAAVHYAVLGAKNATTAPTYINNSAGIPLALNSKAGTAPLAVGSSTVVGKLNADEVDGYHASSFAKVAGKSGIIVADGGSATCPKGTILTGGGGLANSGSLIYSGPDINATSDFVPNTWSSEDSDGGAYATFAVCYNPTGSVPGSVTSASLAKVAAKAKTRATATASGGTTSAPAPTPVRSPNS